MKKCTKCLEIKELDKFRTYKNSKTKKEYIHSFCKSCQNKNKEDYYKANPDKSIIKNRRKALKRHYNMTIQNYNIMYFNQQGLCKICGDHYPKLVIDHCHDSQIIRGLLCNYCNTVLGMSKDKIDILNKAILYLINTNTDKS